MLRNKHTTHLKEPVPFWKKKKRYGIKGDTGTMQFINASTGEVIHECKTDLKDTISLGD
jgi:hypothetical protein